MIQNRIARLQPDYIFAITQKPAGWQPSSLDDVPPSGEILAENYVASYDEAHDDLVRCNQLALDHGLDRWAVILSPDGGL